jgi:hypothetical protein
MLNLFPRTKSVETMGSAAKTAPVNAIKKKNEAAVHGRFHGVWLNAEHL